MSIFDGKHDWRGNPIKQKPTPVRRNPDGSEFTGQVTTPYDRAVQQDQNQFNDALGQYEEDRNFIAGMKDNFLNTPNPFFDAINNGTILDNPMFQRMRRMNQAATAQSLNEIGSKASASFGARGVDPKAFNAQAANEAMRARTDADTKLLGEVTTLFNNAGIARDSTLGSLMNAEINGVGNLERPTYDYTSELLDRNSMEALDKAMQEMMNQDTNQFRDTPWGDFIYDTLEFVQPLLPGNGAWG